MKKFTVLFASLLITFLSYNNLQAESSLFQPIPIENVDSISYIVYFEGDIEEALHSDNAYIKTFLEVYELEVHSTFEYEHNIKGFVLYAPKGQYIATELAKELSLIEDVYMVELEKIEKIPLEI